MNKNIKDLEDIVLSRLHVAKEKEHDLGIFVSYKIDRDAFENGEESDHVNIRFGYSALKVNDDIEIRVLTALLAQLIQRSGANKKQIEAANDIINESVEDA